MSAGGLVAFNILLNAIGSFGIAWVVCRGARRFFRDDGGAALALGALPFAKVAWDAAQGVPAHSFLWQHASGAARELGSFQLGFGVEYGIPRIQIALGALMGDRTYSESAPDVAAAWLSRRVGDVAPAGIATILACAALFFVARQARGWARAASEARALRRRAPLTTLVIGRRSVPVVPIDGAASPFTGGLLFPFIAFPRALWAGLDARERDAALTHEAGHVAQHHLAIVGFCSWVASVFWFVPAVGRSLARLRATCELCADAWAVGRGVEPVVLASALVRVKELAVSFDARPVGRLAAVDATLPARVERLLRRPSAQRAERPGRRIARALAVIWLAATILTAVALGNH